jgi:hypothetical protein
MMDISLALPRVLYIVGAENWSDSVLRNVKSNFRGIASTLDVRGWNPPG